MYVIRNIVRDARTRLHRAVAPARQRNKLFVAGCRIVPERPRSLSEAQFRAEMATIKDLVLKGAVMVMLPDKMRLTSTHKGEFVLMKADGASKVLPKGELPDCFKSAPQKTEPADKVEPPAPTVEVIEEVDESELEPVTEVDAPKKRKKRG